MTPPIRATGHVSFARLVRSASATVFFSFFSFPVLTDQSVSHLTFTHKQTYTHTHIPLTFPSSPRRVMRRRSVSPPSIPSGWWQIHVDRPHHPSQAPALSSAHILKHAQAKASTVTQRPLVTPLLVSATTGSARHAQRLLQGPGGIQVHGMQFGTRLKRHCSLCLQHSVHGDCLCHFGLHEN